MDHARNVGVESFAAIRYADSLQPQATTWFGLLKMNCADILSALEPIPVPSKNSTALGSTRIFTPLSSTTSSVGRTSWAYSTVYDCPAQPPFLIPTRKPTISESARFVSSPIRCAAASVSFMTCGRGRGFGFATGVGDAGVMSVSHSFLAADQRLTTC